MRVGRKEESGRVYVCELCNIWRWGEVDMRRAAGRGFVGYRHVCRGVNYGRCLAEVGMQLHMGNGSGVCVW